ncbi:MAG TPA: DNA/RNA non-specific endonuclease, partial [Opitutaceae bacterium]|nr:DNA/RNA non-specific endonuclease [Opitutaceae bacterium]
MTNYLRRPAAALVAAFLVFTVAARATIDATLQMQLGDPSGATADPTNHSHYLIQRSQYALDYNDNNREPNWVSWDLTSGDVGGSGRSNDFEPDPSLPAGFLAVTTADYNGVGAINFNRGHMCPSEDRTDTLADNLAVFYMTNIVPQSADNNQGPWELFEDYCRQQASAGNEVLITSGPGGFNGSVLPSAAQIQVPAYTWKIAVIVPLGAGSAIDRLNAAGADAIRVIAIQIPNSSGIKSDPWENYKTTVAQIIAETGLNFFNSPALLPAVAAGLQNKPVDGQVATGLPTISVQPIPQSAPVGGSAAFSVTASDNGNPPLTYQWSKDETPISGANGATLTLVGVLAGDAGSYSVTVSNALGSIVSASAPLVVTGLPATIAGQPAPVTASAGSAVVFSVTAGGSAPFTYQWRK